MLLTPLFQHGQLAASSEQEAEILGVTQQHVNPRPPQQHGGEHAQHQTGAPR